MASCSGFSIHNDSRIAQTVLASPQTNASSSTDDGCTISSNRMRRRHALLLGKAVKRFVSANQQLAVSDYWRGHDSFAKVMRRQNVPLTSGFQHGDHAAFTGQINFAVAGTSEA